MIFQGQMTIKAPIQKLWDAILKPDMLAACVPGVESLELKGDNVYVGLIKQKVGPFTFKVNGEVKMVELNAPNHLKGTIKGEVLGKMGTLMGDLIIDFKEAKKDEVEVNYTANVAITGKLSTFGNHIMNAKAKEMQVQITKNLQEKLGTVG